MNNRLFILDSFRGLAIIWIMAYHMLVEHREHYPPIINFIISHGYLGVSVFLFISGYGIASSLSNQSLSPSSFIFKRLKRIYITYWLHLLFIALVLPILTALVSSLKTHQFTINLYHYTFFDWINIASLLQIFKATSWELNRAFLPLNGVIWFIAVLMQIYLVFFLIELCFKSIAKLMLSIVTIFSCLVAVCPALKELIPFGLFLPYFYQFFLGYLFFIYLNNNQQLYLRMVSLDKLFTSNHCLRFFAFIGTFSYSLYLLHVPLWPFVDIFVRNFVPLAPYLAFPLVLMPLIVLISYFWYQLFEKRLAGWVDNSLLGCYSFK